MKTKMMVLFLFISLATFAQESVIPPLGLSFGMTLEAVKIELNLVGTFKVVADYDYGTALDYEDVHTDYGKADLVVTKFVNNALFEVSIYYIVENTEIVKIYDEFYEYFIDKYGEGTTYRNFKHPYEDTDPTDEYELLYGIELGYADVITYWLKPFTNDDGITFETLSSIPAIRIAYQNGVLTEKAMKVETNKNNIVL